MDGNNNIGCIALIILIALSAYCLHLRSDVKKWKSDALYFEDRYYEQRIKVDSLNSQIEEARSYAGSNYDDMSTILDNLVTE